MPINPYARWLGLPESIHQPNYFELLGLPTKIGGNSIDDRSEDLQVKRLVSQAAKQKLQLLSQVTPTDKAKHADVIRRLQQRIVRAAETLSDPGKRRAYVEKIGSIDASLKQRQTETEGRSASNATTPSLPNDRTKSARPATKKSGKSDRKVDGDDDIPFAIPLKGIQNAPANAGQLEATAPVIPLAIPVVETRISKRRRQRKNKIYQWVAGLTAIALCGGLVALLVWMADRPYWLNQPTTQDDLPFQTEDPPANGLSLAEGVNGMNDDEAQPPTPESDAQRVGRMQVDNGDGGQFNEGNFDNDDPARGNADTLNRSSDGLSEIERYQLEKQIRQIIFWMGQRDFDEFQMAIGRMEESLLRWQSQLEPAGDADQQHFATLLAAELQRIDQLYKGFWQQFESGLGRLSGGDELVYQEKVVAFVEKDGDEIVIRDSGRNLRYFWHHLPAPLTIEIGQQAAIADIPTWRLQQAVYLATRPIENPNNRATLDERLNQAAADGHPTEVLRQLLAHHFFGRPVNFADSQTESPEMPNNDEWRHDLRQRFDYANPRDLLPTQADQMAQLWIEMSETERQPHKIHTILDEAADLAAVAQNIARVRAIHLELEQFNGDRSIERELKRWINMVPNLSELDLKNTLELKIAHQRMLNSLEKDGRIEFQPQVKLVKLVKLFTEGVERLSRTHQLYGFARESGRLR